MQTKEVVKNSHTFPIEWSSYLFEYMLKPRQFTLCIHTPNVAKKSSPEGAAAAGVFVDFEDFKPGDSVSAGEGDACRRDGALLILLTLSVLVPRVSGVGEGVGDAARSGAEEDDDDDGTIRAGEECPLEGVLPPEPTLPVPKGGRVGGAFLDARLGLALSASSSSSQDDGDFKLMAAASLG